MRDAKRAARLAIMRAKSKKDTQSTLLARSTNPNYLDNKIEPRVNTLPAHWNSSPNYSDWFSGDLVLSSKTSSVTSGLVGFSQGVVTHSSESIWTHAGVYADNGSVIEATRENGVNKSVLGDTFGSRNGLIRRFNKVNNSKDGQKIVEAAQSLIGSDYGEIIKHTNELGEKQKFICICSTLYEFALLEVFNEPAVHKPINRFFVLPAELVRSPKMGPVTAGWRYVASSQ